MKYTARLPEKNVNISHTHPLKEFFILTGGILFILLGVYIVLGIAVDLIVPRISPEFEKKLVASFAFTSKDELSDSEKKLQELLISLEEKSDLPYELTISIDKNSAVNALALPGGHIRVFSGLIKKVSSENEIAFVLSHEMGHFKNRDHLKGLGRMLVFMALSVAITGSDSSISQYLAQSLMLTELGFSRKQETKADEYAMDILYLQYHHVGGATILFEKLAKENKEEFMGHYLSSHPAYKKRIQHLKEYAKGNGYTIGETKKIAFEEKRK